MDIELDDILKVNIVLLGIQILNSPEQREAFKDIVGTEVVEGTQDIIELAINIPAIGSSPPSPPLPLVLNRERITLNGLPGRSQVEKKYPSDRESDLHRLAEISQIAIEGSDLSGQRLQAYGFNLEAVYNLSVSAGDFLSQRILNPGLFDDLDYQIAGGASSLQMTKGPHLWNLRFEPRFGDYDKNKLFVSFNLHKNSEAIPRENEIFRSLGEVWTQAETIMNSFRKD